MRFNSIRKYIFVYIVLGITVKGKYSVFDSIYPLIRAFSDFKAFLYILIGGFILIGGSDFKAFLYILIGGFS